jgi:phytanoyl-CoA hydroxylase
MPSDRFIYRQTTANPERHVFTPHGHMLNPILNVQSLGGRHFPSFRQAGLTIMTHRAVQHVLRALFGEPGKLVQSMFFHGNSATWAHQDTYYLDAEEIGRMTGAWFAVEDIAPGAGRFFVYPRSHLIDMARNGGDIDIAFHHDRYKTMIVDAIDALGLECRAPALQQGDVLFWSSKTVHGSLETRQPDRSRSSFTAHYIPDSSRFLQFQSRIRGLHLEHVGGMRVHKPKDLDRPTRRSVFWIETTFPKSFALTKKLAIKALTR